MIEVFKTNVIHHDHAIVLIDEIHCAFRDYEANFDLEDRDNILRIKFPHGAVDPEKLIGFLRNFGVEAEVLPDEVTSTAKKFPGLPFCFTYGMHETC